MTSRIWLPHDLRRTGARLCHLAGGELEQIQFLLGHASVQSTEGYLGCKQRLSQAVNDTLGLEDTGWSGDGPQADFGTTSHYVRLFRLLCETPCNRWRLTPSGLNSPTTNQ
jgi:hypothetical protein